MIAERYDDAALPFYRDLVRRVREYDPRLFFRRNLSAGWWELWRWKDSVLVPSAPTAADRCHKAVKQFMVPDEDMGHQFLHVLYASDLARVSARVDADEIERHLQKLDREQEEQDDKEIETLARDFVEDNTRILRRDIFDAYAGCYPSELK